MTTATNRAGAGRNDTFLALAAGLTWTIAATLMGMQADTEPVGVHYDAANRTLVVPLVLLVAWAWRTRSHASRAGTTLTVGFGLMLIGVVVEFWGALLAGEHPSATARRLGEDSHFWGSDPGFGVFIAGALTTIVGFGLLARSRRGTASRVVLVRTGVTGLAVLATTGLWLVSAAAAAVGGIAFALLLVLATDRPGRS